ncbi:MAG: PLP-dependent cysteine synthase family protein [Rectinemataceae bacterium]
MLYRLCLYCEDTYYTLIAEPWDAHAMVAGKPAPAAAHSLPDQPLLMVPVEHHGSLQAFYTELRSHFTRLFLGIKVGVSEPGRFVLHWPENGEGRVDVFRELARFSSPDRHGRVAGSYVELIGKTPLYRLNSLARALGATVLVKLESMEPGSVKDRAVAGMVRAAIDRGELDAETRVVEASSGNVAFAMAAILQAEFGKKPVVFISRMHGPVKAKAVRCAGCPIVVTPGESGTLGAKKASKDYAAATGAWELNQHSNPDNPETHRKTTGPELYHQCFELEGKPPSEFVTGIGSGGTAIGVAMFREDIGADFKIIGVEPAEASLLSGGAFNAHGFSGIAPGFITGIVERERHRLDGIETVSREEGYHTCRRMLAEEGLLVGPTSGASIAVALRRASLPENRGKVIVTIAHDRGDRYLDVDGLFEPPDEATEREIHDVFV